MKSIKKYELSVDIMMFLFVFCYFLLFTAIIHVVGLVLSDIASAFDIPQHYYIAAYLSWKSPYNFLTSAVIVTVRIVYSMFSNIIEDLLYPKTETLVRRKKKPYKSKKMKRKRRKEQIKQRTGQIKQIQKENKMDKKTVGMMCISIGLMVFCLFLAIVSYNIGKKSEKYQKEIYVLERQLADEKQRKLDIEELEKYIETDAYVEKIAREKLNLVMPGDIVFKPKN